MAIKANIGVSRKLGMPEYSSIQASCNLEIELDVRMLDDDPDAFSDRIRHYYGLAQRAVDEELERLRTGRTAAPAPEPARPAPQPPANGAGEHRKQPQDWGDRAKDGLGRERPAAGPAPGGKQPKTGRGLFAWLKDLEEKDESLRGILKWVGAWGKAQGLPWQMNDWNESAVFGGYSEAVRKIGEYQRSDEIQRDLERGGRRGDQLGPNGRYVDSGREGT